jgi:hypothetical protein
MIGSYVTMREGDRMERIDRRVTRAFVCGAIGGLVIWVVAQAVMTLVPVAPDVPNTLV